MPNNELTKLDKIKISKVLKMILGYKPFEIVTRDNGKKLSSTVYVVTDAFGDLTENNRTNVAVHYYVAGVLDTELQEGVKKKILRYGVKNYQQYFLDNQ